MGIDVSVKRKEKVAFGEAFLWAFWFSAAFFLGGELEFIARDFWNGKLGYTYGPTLEKKGKDLLKLYWIYGSGWAVCLSDCELRMRWDMMIRQKTSLQIVPPIHRINEYIIEIKKFRLKFMCS